jgi:hypothetical protein
VFHTVNLRYMLYFLRIWKLPQIRAGFMQREPLLEMSEFSSSDSDDELIILAAQAASIAAASIHEHFRHQELNDDGQNCADHSCGVRDCLTTISSTPYRFKAITNFTADEFVELCSLVCPVISTYARHTGDIRPRVGDLQSCHLNKSWRALSCSSNTTTQQHLILTNGTGQDHL